MKEYYALMKRMTLIGYDCIIEGETEERKGRINELKDKILTFYKPRRFSGENNFEIDFDKQYEKMCLLISQQLHADAKHFSVKKYYTAFEYIKEQNKAQEAETRKQRKGRNNN